MNDCFSFPDFDIEKAIKKFNQIKPHIKNDFFELDIFYSRIHLYSNYVSVAPAHRHSFIELHIPVSGTAQYYINDSFVDMTSETIFLFYPHIAHKIIKCSEDFMSFSIGFSFTSPKHLSQHSSFHNHYSKLYNSTFFVECIKQILILSCEEKVDYYNRINSILSNLIFTIFDNIQPINNELSISPFPAEVKVMSDDSRIRLAITYINDNIDAPISVEEVADYIGISSKQLNRITKKALNITTNNLINELKIKAAIRHMAKPNLSLSQIAIMCGFNSLTHFNLTFKKIMETTPKDFRKLKY